MELCEICESNEKEYAEGKWCASCKEDFKESDNDPCQCDSHICPTNEGNGCTNNPSGESELCKECEAWCATAPMGESLNTN